MCSRATVAPPYRGGALVRFPVQRLQRSEGRILLVIDGEERAPTYGELTVTMAGQQVASPVGASGQFYFENLPAGRHAAGVESRDGACRFTLEIPVVDAAVVDLGVIRCTVSGGR